MATIHFNNKSFEIPEAALSVASGTLRNHLSTVMNGTGATIKLDGQSYGIDATKLSAATTEFVTHLGTISGSGSKVKVGGVEYGIGTDKVSGAVAELEAHWGALNNPDAPSTDETLEGDGQEFHKFAPTALTFRSTAPLNELQEVQINGVTVDPSNYTLEEGSTVVTLPIEYLQTLDVDNYEITVVSDSKSAKGGFSVVEPELNEHGFYYNQPYTAYVQVFGVNTAVFIRNDNTLDLIVTDTGYVETCNYVIADNQLTITSAMGTFTASFMDNGNSAFINELYTTFVLGDNRIAADDDYIYVYKEDLGGYEVKCIDTTKAEYGDIKTGINGIETVKLADYTFAMLVDDGESVGIYEHVLEAFPKIPNSVIIVGRHAFSGCVGFASVELPNNIKTIGIGAFQTCGSMISITIPNSVEIISDSAFFMCQRLGSIIFEGTIEQWNAITKGDQWNIHVPATHIQCTDGQVAL